MLACAVLDDRAALQACLVVSDDAQSALVAVLLSRSCHASKSPSQFPVLESCKADVCLVCRYEESIIGRTSLYGGGVGFR